MKRVISGSVFLAVVAGFFLLRQFTPYPQLFDILIYFFLVAGTFELGRAIKPFSVSGTHIGSVIYAALFAPVYVISEEFIISGMGWLFALTFCILALLILTVRCIIQNKDMKTFAVSALPLVYPALFILTMLLSNDFSEPKGFLALLMLFVIAPFSDTFAFITGSLIGGKKLCPKLSPKKTWSGAIGGVIGGGIGGLLVYFIFIESAQTVNFFSPVLLFILLGLFASIMTEAGDLFESFIKRRAGIKDMGKIMPGHGGIMDRIDGMLFASVLIYLVFLFV